MVVEEDCSGGGRSLSASASVHVDRWRAPEPRKKTPFKLPRKRNFEFGTSDLAALPPTAGSLARAFNRTAIEIFVTIQHEFLKG